MSTKSGTSAEADEMEGALIHLRRHLSAALVVAGTAAATGAMDRALAERVDALYGDVCEQIRAVTTH